MPRRQRNRGRKPSATAPSTLHPATTIPRAFRGTVVGALNTIPVEYGPTATTSTPVFLNLAPLSQGTGQSDRIGNLVSLRRITGNWSASAQDAFNDVRFMIVLDNASGGAAPTIAEVLSGSLYTISPYNPQTRDTLLVLYDKIIHLTLSGDGNKGGSFDVDLAGVEVFYPSASAIPNRNALYGVVITDSAVSGPAVQVSALLEYNP